ncbi:YALIA101S04e02058g1_1 [Yarrowia lipolytica]|uniref:Major facilitator superfamily domain-containing protein n=1 Tax=Yarrowia lipolytica TaxID=4952 RepID=A0A371C367_YARLL|nr:major facilitator superfamily domain-containing protein [Yarrowia lipolytica]SEI33774.1 YALIA101S04e02058g1_1 [Yarrowia lipolytica]
MLSEHLSGKKRIYIDVEKELGSRNSFRMVETDPIAPTDSDTPSETQNYTEKQDTEHIEDASPAGEAKHSSEQVEQAKQSADHIEHAKLSTEHVENAADPTAVLGDTSVFKKVSSHPESLEAGHVTTLTAKQSHHLKFHRSLAIACQCQAFYVSHIVSRDVIGPALGAGILQFNHITVDQYEWTETALYFPYAFLAIPFAFLFLKVNIRIWFAVEMFCWGLCICLLGVCHNYAGLVADRVIMGVCMNFCLPAVLHVIFQWHGRYEAQFVFACAWGAAWFMVPLFTLIAIALGLIHDKKPGWSWQFFVTGICGCIQTPLIWRLLPDYFWSQKWIKKHGQDGYEFFKQFTEDDYAGGNPVEPTETPLEGLLLAAKDPIVWTCSVLGLFTYHGLDCCYALLMSPTLMSVGKTSAIAQLICWTMIVFGCFWTVVQGWCSFKLRVNYPFLLMNYLFTIIGWALILCKPGDRNPWIKFGGGWFVIPNTMAAFVVVACWLGSNIQGRHRRLMSFAIFAMVSDTFAIIALRTFIAREAPQYHRGCWIAMGFTIACVVLSTVLRGALGWKNRSNTDGFIYLL